MKQTFQAYIFYIIRICIIVDFLYYEVYIIINIFNKIGGISMISKMIKKIGMTSANLLNVFSYQQIKKIVLLSSVIFASARFYKFYIWKGG